MLTQMAKDFDFEKHKEMLLKKGDEFYANLPKFDLSLSRNKVVSFIDPTRVYEDEFWGVERDLKSGKLRWKKVAEAGKEVNWLEHNPTPMPVYFIFDYDSQVQREIAKQIAESGDERIKLVFTGGDIKSANEFLKYPLTYLNDSMVREYEIYYTPTLIKRGEGVNINNYQNIRFDMDDITFGEVLGEVYVK